MPSREHSRLAGQTADEYSDPVKPADAKLQRWIDLLAALLSHRFGVTFADLKRLVPAYGQAKDPATVARMFERDKDELRALGLPIRVRDDDTEEVTTQRYYVRAREMYLPFLALTSQPAGPPRTPPAGYRDIPSITFEPDELSAIIRAARSAKQVGDPDLTRDVESAISKLTYDLGHAIGSVVGESEEHAVRNPESGAAPTVSVLGEALLRRKTVAFVYHSINRDVTEERMVEPYGLAFSSGHWYMVGRDVSTDALRKFRVSRMERVRANNKKPQSVDYEIPKAFDLASHARAKEPWELGEDAAEEMIVEIRGQTGAAESVRSLGATVAGHPSQRRFQVRRVDSFVRWIMSFAGDIVPVAPAALREQYRTVIGATLSAYEE
jgi:proteasome accessory factor B